ncbi:hypothetical protein [Sphingomonas jatrophae]|uniref:Uncharacterized protein n=1 Tax=Sphingomonas jatrophae TaxID=1166337 RepID=A0A1I6M815_9SPHN|nr:hypothetical protein [Sphingomonas jatrophae]SFS11817.1 hypothetical protein SAMN05192580_3640 [Sphingomonas jatrophae]
MLHFGRKLFGRKGVADHPAPDAAAPPTRLRSFLRPSETEAPQPGTMTFDRLLGELTRSTRDGQVGAYAFKTPLEQLSPSERMEVIVSLADEMAELKGYVVGSPSDRASQMEYCYATCLKSEIVADKEHLGSLITCLVGSDRYHRSYRQEEFGALMALMRQAVKAGGFLTSDDCASLAAFATTLRTAAEKERGKPDKKALIARAEAIEKFAGVEVSATSLLLERCEPAETGRTLGPCPEHYLFWCRLLAATAHGVAAIAEDVKSKRRVAWMSDPTAFAERFPAAGPLTPRFRQWEDPALAEDARNFARLRRMLRDKRNGLVAPADFLALPGKRPLVEPMFRFDWRTPNLPALDRLGDLEDPQQTALLEQLISARNAPRPTAKWLKQIVAAAEAVGMSAVEARLHDWLALFHTPVTSPTILADALNIDEMDRGVAHLNALLPHWPVEIGEDGIDAAGHALAVELASGNPSALPTPLTLELFAYNDDYWEGRSPTRGRLKLIVPKDPRDRWSSPSIFSWQAVSIENEQPLRGALWLVARMPDRARAIDAIERTALSAACRLHLGDNSHRSKVVANAAIATLIDMGGADVQPAILRLSRAIPDRTINPPLIKALNG